METTKISSPQGTTPAHAARPQATAQAPDANGSGGGGGFLALLAALGSSGQGDGEALNGLAGPGLGASDGAAQPLDASALAAWQGLLPGAVAGALQPDAMEARAGSSAISTVGQGNTGPGLGLAGNNGLQGGSWVAAGAVMGADGAPLGMVAETAALDNSAELQEGAARAGAPAHGRGGFSRIQGGAAPKADGTEVWGTRSQAGVPGVSSVGHAVAALAGAASVGEHAAVVTAAAPGERGTGHFASALAGAAVVAPMVEGLAAAAGAPGGSDGAGHRPGEGRAEATLWTEGASGGSGPAEAGSLDGTSVFTDPSQAGSEEQVAEQVAYWVNQKTQNAELTLQRDGQPVEVSVTLSGNEAHVSFRSDQAHTRELLDQSMAQLSELLRNEGLVLSGMSVGTSSSGQRGDAEASERQSQRDGARQARVVAAAPVGSASLLRGGAPDRALDVFV